MSIDRLLVQLFRVLIAALFLFSAISKIVSLPFFDGLVAELLLGKAYYENPTGLYWVQWFTRGMISAELILGIGVLQPRMLKKWVLPGLTLMLVLFTGHLIYEGLNKGFIGGNCGCFGDVMPMDIAESIVKNVLTLVMIGYVWKKYHPRFQFSTLFIPIFTGVVTFLVLLLTVKSNEAPKQLPKQEYFNEQSTIDTIASPSFEQGDSLSKDTLEEIQTKASTQTSAAVENKEVKEKPVVESVEKPVTNQKDEVKVVPPKVKPNSIYQNYTKFSNGQIVDLDQGNKLVCLFSLTCGHCQQAYKELCEMKASGKLPDTYLILYGSQFDLNYFMGQAGCSDPYIRLENYTEFQQLLGGVSFPKIVNRESGKDLKMWDYDTYSAESMMTYYGIPVPQKEVPKEEGIKLNDNGGGLQYEQKDPFAKDPF